MGTGGTAHLCRYERSPAVWAGEVLRAFQAWIPMQSAWPYHILLCGPLRAHTIRRESRQPLMHKEAHVRPYCSTHTCSSPRTLALLFVGAAADRRAAGATGADRGAGDAYRGTDGTGERTENEIGGEP